MTSIPDTYKVVNILPPRVLILEEMSIGTASSVIAGLTSSISFITSIDGTANPISNRYNYLHTTKINNSNIKSGIFRRSYTKNSVIYNQGYNNKDFDLTNLPTIKSLLFTDSILRNTGNNINSGILLDNKRN